MLPRGSSSQFPLDLASPIYRALVTERARGAEGPTYGLEELEFPGWSLIHNARRSVNVILILILNIYFCTFFKTSFSGPSLACLAVFHAGALASREVAYTNLFQQPPLGSAFLPLGRMLKGEHFTGSASQLIQALWLFCGWTDKTRQDKPKGTFCFARKH